MPLSLLPERRFGVELEARPTMSFQRMASLISSTGEPVRNLGGAYEHTRNNMDWVVKGDASCGDSTNHWGLEVCSPVLLGVSGLTRLGTVMGKVVAYSTRYNKLLLSERCGLHVHVDVSDYTKSDLRKLVLLYLRFEKTIYNLVNFSRRDRSYCHTWANIPAPSTVPYGIHQMLAAQGKLGGTTGYHHLKVAHFFDVAKTSEEIKELYVALFSNYMGSSRVGLPRNLGLNLANFWNYGTVEFRMHEGTWDKNVVTQWITLLVAFCQVAKDLRSVRVASKDSLDALFQVLGWDKETTEEAIKLTQHFNHRKLVSNMILEVAP